MAITSTQVVCMRKYSVVYIILLLDSLSPQRQRARSSLLFNSNPGLSKTVDYSLSDVYIYEYLRNVLCSVILISGSLNVTLVQCCSFDSN